MRVNAVVPAAGPFREFAEYLARAFKRSPRDALTDLKVGDQNPGELIREAGFRSTD